MMKLKLNLHNRLLFSLLAILVAGFLLLGMILLGDSKSQINEFRMTQAKFQAKTLAEASLDGLVTKDYELLERWVHSSMPSSDYAYAALVRPDGKVFTHTDLSHIGDFVSTTVNSKVVSTKATRFKGRPVLEVIHPAKIGDKVLANAHLAYYLDTDFVLQGQTVTRVLLVLLFILFTIFLAAHFVTLSITAPIELLKRSISNASLDKVLCFDQQLESRTDEVGELTRTFKRMSENLVKSHKDLTISLLYNKAIVDSAIDSIIVIDSKGQVESINQAAESLFGYAAEELVGNNISLLMPESLRKLHSEYLQQYKRSSGPKVIGSRRQIQGLRKDGTTFPIEIALGEIYIDGQLKFTGTIRDISSRQEYEQAIIVARDAAQQANRAKSEFLTNISHELRTPMNGVLGYLDLLKIGELTETQKAYVNTASQSAHELLNIINNILEFINIDKGNFVLDIVEFNIDKMLRALIKQYAKQLRNKSIVFKQEVDPEIPRCLSGDPLRITKVIDQFISNACKFTKQGEIKLSVMLVSTQGDKASIRFEISDTGIGIEPADKARVFELFTQVDGSYTRLYGGTGIGLSLCKSLVEVMQGEIGVQSNPGEGSVFWFSIPLLVAASEQEQDKVNRDVVMQVEETPIDNKSQILVVEDNAFNQDLMIALLESMKYKADIVENGLLAVEAVEKGQYDLILMDCQMPVMNGYEATQRIRQLENGHTPIVAVTAHALDGDREKCIDSGMDDYMSKPFSKDDLQHILQKWIKNYKA